MEDIYFEKFENLKKDFNIMKLEDCDYSDEILKEIDINFKSPYNGDNALSTIILSNCDLDVKKIMLKKLLDRGANPHEKLTLFNNQLITTPYELAQNNVPELLEIFDLKELDLIPTQRFNFSSKKYINEVKKELIKNLKKEGFPKKEIKYRMNDIDKQITGHQYYINDL